MAKRVFFSFHYKDVVDFRANVIRQHGVTKERGEAGFFDASLWESGKKKGDEALKELIQNGLNNTSNTCVLIGSETYQRPWVKYEIFKSMDVGNHIFGIHVNEIGNYQSNIQPKTLGPNPFDYLGVRHDGNGFIAIEYQGGRWQTFDKIYRIKFNSGSPSIFANHNYTLSQFFRTYRWKADDGFNNFTNWLK